jgi:hypothetical protein
MLDKTAPATPPTATIVHNGRTFQVTPRAQFEADVASAVALAKAANLKPAQMPASSPPASFSLAQCQTPFRDQGDRDTCWAFAGGAAVEAACKRKYGLTLYLSPQYISHINKVQELAYDIMAPTRTHENNSTVWGFQGSADIVTKMARSAVCQDADAPYLSQAQLLSYLNTVPNGSSITAVNGNPLQSVMDQFEFLDALVPSAARAKCMYQVTSFQYVGSAITPAVLEGVLAGGHEVVVSISLFYSVDSNGVWQYDSSANGGGHCVLLIGYDRNNQVFLAKNSWADTDFTKMSYEYITKCCSLAYAVLDVSDPSAGPAKRAFWMGTWNMDYDGWRGTLNFRRHTNYHDQSDGPTRLGSFVRDGQIYDVNGHFDDGYQHCALYIAPNTDRVTPGTETGQRFDLYCFSWDVEHAAGTTTLSNVTYGALLSRPALPPFVEKTFEPSDWVGTYAMNFDGWQGTLQITGMAPFAATYTDGNGKAYKATGSTSGHELKLTIPFPNYNQPFDLLHHTWEKGVFSGTTTSAGHTFGVLGFLKS